MSRLETLRRSPEGGQDGLAIQAASFILPDDIELRLDALAKATGRTKTFYARQAILQHIEDLEDIYLAESRLEALRAGRTKTTSLDDVEKELGLAD